MKVVVVQTKLFFSQNLFTQLIHRTKSANQTKIFVVFILGLVEDMVQHWSWYESGGNLKFTNWLVGQPDSGNRLSSCGLMRTDGRWKVADCDITMPSICQKNSDNDAGINAGIMFYMSIDFSRNS